MDVVLLPFVTETKQNFWLLMINVRFPRLLGGDVGLLDMSRNGI